VIKKAKSIPKERALQRVKKRTSQWIPVFLVECKHSLLSLSAILQKHWRVRVDDPHFKDIFPLSPPI
jgi:hypothetical protein